MSNHKVPTRSLYYFQNDLYSTFSKISLIIEKMNLQHIHENILGSVSILISLTAGSIANSTKSSKILSSVFLADLALSSTKTSQLGVNIWR